MFVLVKILKLFDAGCDLIIKAKLELLQKVK